MSTALGLSDLDLARTETPSSQWVQIIRRDDTTSWLFEALKLVLRAVPKVDNWDGYGSIAPGDAVKRRSVELLAAMEDDEPPLPRVVPVPGGGLQLEWRMGDRELEIEVLPDGSVEYLIVASNKMLEGRLAKPDRTSVRALILPVLLAR